MTYILGGWQSDFSVNWTREGMELADGFAQVVREGLAATGLEAKDIECGHVGNFVADLFAGQGLLGGFFGGGSQTVGFPATSSGREFMGGDVTATAMPAADSPV